MSEEELVRLLVSNRRMILGYVTTLLGNRDLADDVYQEVAIVALKKRKTAGEIRSPSAWLRQISKYQAFNAARKKDLICLDSNVVELLDAVWDARDKRESEQADALRHCIKLLPTNLKKVVEMKYQQGRSADEMSRNLQLPVETIYVYVSRLHRNLRACIEGFMANRDRQEGQR